MKTNTPTRKITFLSNETHINNIISTLTDQHFIAWYTKYCDPESFRMIAVFAVGSSSTYVAMWPIFAVDQQHVSLLDNTKQINSLSTITYDEAMFRRSDAVSMETYLDQYAPKFKSELNSNTSFRFAGYLDVEQQAENDIPRM